MKRIGTLLSLLFAFFMVTAVGCHAQPTPTPHNVALTWGAPSGGTPPYSYIMSAVSVATGTKTCPTAAFANGTTPATYTPLNSANPVSVLAYTDSTASGTMCYVVSAIDSALNTGGFSNTAGPFVVPTNPSAPQSLTGSASTAHVAQPTLRPSAKGADGPSVVAKLEGHIR